ncbi:MAG: AAA family ATPase, partial [Actinomycetota bacterium]|nr:AAA family ATPase [Actinomycetota bacterium]
MLVGRQDELRWILEALGEPPALVFVEGEAGVGKSRLVREALSSPAARDTRVLVGHCHRLREPFLLGPVIEALRGAGTTPPDRPLSPVVGALQPLLPELADMLPPEPRRIGDPRAERHRIFRALRELLGALGPTVCVLEDLHWADEGTLEFLAFLLSQPPESVSLVLTYRGEDLPAQSSLGALTSCLPREVQHATIRLAALSVSQVGELVCALLKTASVSDELTSYLHGLTGGIPFTLEEVVRLLRDRDQAGGASAWRTAEELHELGVPPAVRQSIIERMAPFTGDARLVVEAAAVLAVPSSEELIASVAGLQARRAAKGITRALSGAVLEERGVGLYGFRHALAAQAVYDDIPGPERRRLHLRAAEALGSGPEPRPLSQLAHHFREAGRPRQWARHAEAAADAASSVGDDRAAARLLEDALSAPGLSRAASVRIAIKVGPAALYSANPESAIGPLQRVLDEQHMSMGARGELRYWISRLRCQTGDTGPWREEMARAAGELRARPELAARAMVNLAWPVYGDANVNDDLAWLERAVEAAARTEDSAAKIAVHAQRAAILLSIGDPAGWSALDDAPAQASSVEEKLQLLRGYHSLSVTAVGLGYHRRGEAFLEHVARLDDELEHVSWGAWRESTRLSIDWRIGGWEGLEARIADLSHRTRGRLGVVASNQLILSWLLLAQNRLNEAERGFTSALELAQARQWTTSPVTTRAGLARIRLAQGVPGEACAVAAPGLEVIRRKAIWVWGREIVPIAVQALLARGDPHAARGLAQEFAAGIAGRDAPAARGASRFCQGAVAEGEGDHLAAARLFSEAERIWSGLPFPYEAAGAREARGRCLLAADDEEGADVLLEALKTFAKLGARLDAGRTRAALKERGIALPPESRGGRRPYGDELSPREAEVAQLAGMGRKNREIAEMLFLSQRTVETHVASALRKLGAESREDLAGALA